MWKLYQNPYKNVEWFFLGNYYNYKIFWRQAWLKGIKLELDCTYFFPHDPKTETLVLPVTGWEWI